MRRCRIAPGLAVGLVGWGLALSGPAVAPAQESKKAATKPDAGSGQEFDSREKLDAYYAEQTDRLQARRIADLTALAAKQSGAEAEDTYRHLFYRAMAHDQYEAAEAAADAYMEKGDDPKLRGLATFVQVIAEADRGAYDRSLQHLRAFLKTPEPGTARAGSLDPQTVFGVGESYLQHLMNVGRYDAAVKVARLLTEGDLDESIKEHFQGRLDRLQMVGKPAPAIDAKDVDGEPVKLADFKGKVVLVDFWATWCPPCLATMPDLKSLRSKYRDRGFEIIGINVDNARKGAKADEVQTMVRDVLIDFRAGWPNILAGAGKDGLTRDYGVTDIPASFLVGRDGKILKVELSGDGLEKAVAEAVGAGDGSKAGADSKSTRRRPR